MKMQPSARQLEGFWNKVDRTSTCWLWTGATSGAGYGRINVRGTTVYAHRLSLELTGICIPDGHDVDHLCHNRRCVNPDHLRIATRAENNQNFGRAHAHSRTGIRGVSWSKRAAKWRVSATRDGHQFHGGLYDDLAEAEQAAKNLRNRIYTHNEMDRTERKAS